MSANGSIFDLFVCHGEPVTRVIEGVRFSVAAIEGNDQWRRAIDALPEPQRRAWEDGELSDDDARRITARLVAQGLLRGWDGPVDEPYSTEVAEDLFYRAPHLALEVLRIAREWRNYTLRSREADAKN